MAKNWFIGFCGWKVKSCCVIFYRQTSSSFTKNFQNHLRAVNTGNILKRFIIASKMMKQLFLSHKFHMKDDDGILQAHIYSTKKLFNILHCLTTTTTSSSSSSSFLLEGKFSSALRLKWNICYEFEIEVEREKWIRLYTNDRERVKKTEEFLWKVWMR